MGKATANCWQAMVFTELGNAASVSGKRPSGALLLERMEQEYALMPSWKSEKLEPPPSSTRTYDRLIKQFEALPDEERRQYELFYWPESLERSRLPPEAGAEMLRMLETDGRVTIRRAKWQWRVLSAAPDCPSWERGCIARYLTAMEATGQLTFENRRACEYWLAFHGWDEKARDRYEKVIAERGVERWQELWPLSKDYPTAVAEMVHGFGLKKEWAESILRGSGAFRQQEPA